MKQIILGSAVAIASLTLAFGARAADGEAVYNQHCAMCHNAMPPKLGDKAAWAPLIKQGTDALVANTIKGKGAMPPQGANASEADIRAAVEFMVSKAQ
jgi:cytochrome c5